MFQQRVDFNSDHGESVNSDLSHYDIFTHITTLVKTNLYILYNTPEFKKMKYVYARHCIR